MKPKHIITLTACLFLLLANLSAKAEGKERVYITFGLFIEKALYHNGCWIYEKGEMKSFKLVADKEKEKNEDEVLKARFEVLEKYLSAGYKLISQETRGTSTTEYILER